MNEVFNLISKLRTELELCRTGDNDTNVFNAVQTVNQIDNLLLNRKLPIPNLGCRVCEHHYLWDDDEKRHCEFCNDRPDDI